ncbi:hypothetical protein [uncultured Zhongshania sp.]|uniref:hypothetical protein n=1 Tax=uncultured Zhongshania sp. TaxID=1642288 RepID=UPI0025E83D6E|nr:hypothetical protein [uncultured Zhongshania sp.]
MSDWCIQHLEYFSPLSAWDSSQYDLVLPDRFDMIVTRAAYRFRNKTDQQIDDLIKRVDTILRGHFDKEHGWRNIERHFIEDSDHYDKIYSERDQMFGPIVASYLNMIDDFEINRRSVLKGTSWSEVFCLLALNELGWAIDEAKHDPDGDSDDDWMSGYGKLDRESYFLFDALALISTAELMGDDEKSRLFSFARKRNSVVKLSNSQAEKANDRHRKTNRVKRDFVAATLREKRKGSDKSIHNLAISYHAKLVPGKNDKQIITKLTLTRAWTSYSKGELKKL